MLGIHALTKLAVDVEIELRRTADRMLEFGIHNKVYGLIAHILGNLQSEMEPSVSVLSRSEVFSDGEGLEFIERRRRVTDLVFARTVGDVLKIPCVTIYGFFDDVQIFLDLSELCFHGDSFNSFFRAYYIILFRFFQQKAMKNFICF